MSRIIMIAVLLFAVIGGAFFAADLIQNGIGGIIRNRNQYQSLEIERERARQIEAEKQLALIRIDADSARGERFQRLFVLIIVAIGFCSSSLICILFLFGYVFSMQARLEHEKNLYIRGRHETFKLENAAYELERN